MCLRFMFLLTTRLAAWLRLARREETWKTAESLILHHQLAVLQQQPRRPKLNWADRALLATLLAVIPEARRHGLRLLVTPDTIVRWHRDIARRRWAARSKRGKTGRPATRRKPRLGLPQDSRRTGRAGGRSLCSTPCASSSSSTTPTGLTRESPTPGHCVRCPHRSPSRPLPPASTSTDATASAASSTSTGMPLNLHG